MGILNIVDAERSGSKLLIVIAGTTGSGKTFTALKMARGMVENTSEIGFLDTENGRGAHYANILDGRFKYAEMRSPFSPLRYRQAISEFQDAGVKVLVIDSGSHEWEGDGGCTDIAEAPLLNGKKMANWIGAKGEHKKYMSSLLQSSMHIIICLRAREKFDFRNPKEPVSLGLTPICEKDFMYEATVSFLIAQAGQNQLFTKIPADLRPVFFSSGEGFEHNGVLGEAHGAGLLKWVNDGVKPDEEVEHWRGRMQLAASNGVAALDEECKKMPEKVKPKMRSIYPIIKASAVEFERIAALMVDRDVPLAALNITPEDNFNPAKVNAEEKTHNDPSTTNQKEEKVSKPIEDF